MRIPGYDLGERLARSDVLDVHEAWSRERGCSVIVKSLRPDRRGDARAARSLRREGRLLESLSHPHLVRAYEVLHEPVDAVVLETLGGETLAHLVRRRDRRLSAAELSFLGQHLCSAVGYLHGRGWLHLDLKPSNVVADGGRAKLIDLSIARRPGRVRSSPAGCRRRAGRRACLRAPPRRNRPCCPRSGRRADRSWSARAARTRAESSARH